MVKRWNESQPKKLSPGEWHLPFIENLDEFRLNTYDPTCTIAPIEAAIRVSVARCAHLTHEDFSTGKPMTIEKCLEVYDRLVGSTPIHASPAEHQATPDTDWQGNLSPIGNDLPHIWAHPELHGNLPGWQQYRKMLPDESLAPLPEGYQRK